MLRPRPQTLFNTITPTLTPTVKNHFGGPLPRTDLSLLTCGIHRYVLKSTELECSQDDTTILCPANALTTVKEPKWLGLPWTPNSRLQFKQTHQILSHCKQLRPMTLLGGRYYLATVFHNITLTTSHAEQEGLKDNLEETVPTASGLQVPVITSPADIYKYFPRRVTFQDEIRERFSGTDTYYYYYYYYYYYWG